MKPLLFYSGETSEIPDAEKSSKSTKAVSRDDPGNRVTAKPGAAKISKKNSREEDIHHLTLDYGE